MATAMPLPAPPFPGSPFPGANGNGVPAPGAGLKAEASNADKTVSAVLGEIVWPERWAAVAAASLPGEGATMPGDAAKSQSPKYKTFMIQDLEQSVMPAVLFRQFRLYYDRGIPAGAVLYARMSPEAAARHEVDPSLATEAAPLRPADWQSGGTIRIVEFIAPFGGREEIEKEFGETVR